MQEIWRFVVPKPVVYVAVGKETRIQAAYLHEGKLDLDP